MVIIDLTVRADAAISFLLPFALSRLATSDPAPDCRSDQPVMTAVVPCCAADNGAFDASLRLRWRRNGH
jgi:hypothetical protein